MTQRTLSLSAAIASLLAGFSLAGAGPALAAEEWHACGLRPVVPVQMSALQAGRLRTMSSLRAVGDFQITLVPGPGLQANAAALAAFERAASRWEAVIRDPMTVTIEIDLDASLPGNTLASTGPRLFVFPRDVSASWLANDAALEPPDAVALLLPSAAPTLSAAVPPGYSFDNSAVVFSKASLKALGLDADTPLGASDGTIVFNPNFAFDFDNRNGVGANTFDFETAAVHEIGHLLGFISILDYVEAGLSSPIPPATLDLFRFATAPFSSPDSAGEFVSLPRNLQFGVEANFDDIDHELMMSTGLSGDGRQSSHWKANELTGITLGVMDPTFAPQEVVPISAGDKRALDLIGYDIAAADALPTLSVLVRPGPGSSANVVGGNGSNPVVAGNTPVELVATAADGDGLGFPVLAALGATAPVSFVWDLGGLDPLNGSLAILSPAPVVRFDLPPGATTRTMPISVDTYDTLGDSTGLDLAVRVSEPPAVSIEVPGAGPGPVPVAAGMPLQLQAVVADEDGVGFPIFQALGNNLPVRFVWDFGGAQNAGGLAAFTDNPIVRFQLPAGQAAGNFSVSLTGYDALGLSATQTRVFQVNRPPVVNLLVNGSAAGASLSIVSGTRVQFNTTASDPDGLGFPIFSRFGNNLPVVYVWDFGGAQPPSLANFAAAPAVTFRLAPGETSRVFNVALTVFDAKGFATTRGLRVNVTR